MKFSIELVVALVTTISSAALVIWNSSAATAAISLQVQENKQELSSLRDSTQPKAIILKDLELLRKDIELLSQRSRHCFK